MWPQTGWMAGASALVLVAMGAQGKGCEAEPGEGGGARVEAGEPTAVPSLADTSTGVVVPPVSGADQNADLTYLREEEKLARDVYRVLGERWGLRVFDNISASEETHMARALGRLNDLGLRDPVVDDRTGAFVDPTLASLFTTLTTKGETSLAAALQVGATIEDLDIADLQAMETRTDDAATLAVYDNLMCGSRNHMRAFVRQIEMGGARYVAQYLDQAEVDAIVSTPQERCGQR